MGQCALIEIISFERQWFTVGRWRHAQAASVHLLFLQSFSWYSSSHRTLSLCFSSMCESGAKIFGYRALCSRPRPSKTWLIQRIFRSMPLLQQIQPIMQRILSHPPLARGPVVPAARRALLHSAGVVSATGTAGDLWPPGLRHPSHHRQQPIKTRSFPLQTQWKSLQIPSHHFNSSFILRQKTELSTNPWLSIRASSSVGLVWRDESALRFQLATESVLLDIWY